MLTVVVAVATVCSLLAEGRALANVFPLQPVRPQVVMTRVIEKPVMPRPATPARAPRPVRRVAPARPPAVREVPVLRATTPSRSCSGGSYILVKHYPQYEHATQSGCASNYSGGAGECASNNAPIGTILTITNTDTHASTTCRVAGTGPFVSGRPVDLTQGVFARLAPLSQGTFHVRVSW